jgi:hypothetical protein
MYDPLLSTARPENPPYRRSLEVITIPPRQVSFPKSWRSGKEGSRTKGRTLTSIRPFAALERNTGYSKNQAARIIAIVAVNMDTTYFFMPDLPQLIIGMGIFAYIGYCPVLYAYVNKTGSKQ